jgi:anti-sigma factor RsiW
VKVMRDDLHVLTGSYVMDAISDAERAEFERHLQHCPHLRG